MSYTPTEWTTGDTITAEKLNKIEGGIESAESKVVYVTYTNDSSWECEYTASEIVDFIEAGCTVIAKMPKEESPGFYYWPLADYSKSGNNVSVYFCIVTLSSTNGSSTATVNQNSLLHNNTSGSENITVSNVRAKFTKVS